MRVSADKISGGYLLAAVVLVAGLSRAAAATDTALEATAPLSPACQRLDDAFSTTKNGIARASRSVSAQGRTRTLRVYWDGRAPSRAAAALLAAVLRHATRYSQVELTLAPRLRMHMSRLPTVCSLAFYMKENCSKLEYTSSAYDNVVISPAMTYGGRCISLEHCFPSTRDNWVSEPRLQLEVASAVSATLRLHARLAPPALYHHDCKRASSWAFYQDTADFERCLFTQSDKADSPAIVYTLIDQETVIDDLRQRIAARALHLIITPLEPSAKARTKLLQLLNEPKSSFLFLDYNLWNDKEEVMEVTPPPPLDDKYPVALESVQTVRVADDFVLRQIAPTVLKTLQKFAPSPIDLRQILEQEEKSKRGIVDAVCVWANNNTDKFASFQVEYKQQHWVAIFLCANDPDKEKYRKVANASITEDYNAELELTIGLYFVEIDCASEEELNNEYFKTFLSHKWQRLIGVAAAGSGLKTAVESAPGVETALVYYDVPGPDVQLGTHALATAGSTYELATAIAYFLTVFEWKRLALITENTELGKGLHKTLKRNKKLTLHNNLLCDVTAAVVVDMLKNLQNKESRIILVNTNATIAETILCKAYDLGMTDLKKYVWILRERRAVDLKCGNVSIQMEHYSISFWWRGGDDSYLDPIKNGSDKTGLTMRNKLGGLWRGDSWPPLASPLADAIQVLIKKFKQFARNYPEKFYDIHGHGTSELLLNSDDTQEINGIVQKLQFINGTIADPLVFVELWKNNQHDILFKWRIHNKKVEVIAQIQRNIYNGSPPTDGSSFCIIATGDAFLPRCHDRILYATLGIILILLLGLYLARRVRMKRLARRDALLTAQLLAQREFVTNALVEHYVDRAALELYHELGHGCYGRVRYGVLRAPERHPVLVAVKESRDDVSAAEESELLREACTIAALRHDHVVRLIGVCATGGPLLVLMEYAFYGDLREYLWQRRHLVERITETNFDENDETYHVSAVSLTRLAKEAASALEYLANERLVHRDVRASNCLVDARRSLKLGDFGLARSTGTGLAGEAEYTCRRRGLFPVLWMAPESLERGVFTAASDAWALGVLLLELVTLGSRPYATLPPLRVIRYVCAGGRPPLPPDASPETRRILTECWRGAPEERLSAAELVTMLEASPEALRPALQPAVEPSDEDCPTLDSTPVESV